MTAQSFVVCRAAIIRRGVVVALLALGACSNGAGNPSQDAAHVSIAGHLTLKGAEPGAWWAVTDDQGRVWKISSPTREQVAVFNQVQNRLVSVEGRRDGKYLNFEQIHPLRISVLP